MSFSMQVKEELLKQISPARHCRIAETAAIIWLCGKYSYKKSQGGYIKVSTENLTVASKYFILLEKTFKIRAEVMVRGSHNTTYYQVVVHNDEDVLNVLKAVKLIRSDDEDVLDTRRYRQHYYSEYMLQACVHTRSIYGGGVDYRPGKILSF